MTVLNRRLWRVIALALAFTATPACATPILPQPAVVSENPLETHAFALLRAYAAVLEEAADLARDPRVPDAVKRALVEAEAAATPAAEALHAAAVAYMQAHDAPERADAQRRLQLSAAAAESAVSRLQAIVCWRQGERPCAE